MNKLGKICLCVIVACVSTVLDGQAQERKAPAYPLITHNPNFSIWSMTDQLHASTTKHWTDADHSLLGLIDVDGHIYRFLGKEEPSYAVILPTAEDKSYTVQYTESKPQGGWESSAYNTDTWKSGLAPIGDDEKQVKTCLLYTSPSPRD